MVDLRCVWIGAVEMAGGLAGGEGGELLRREVRGGIETWGIKVTLMKSMKIKLEFKQH